MLVICVIDSVTPPIGCKPKTGMQSRLIKD